MDGGYLCGQKSVQILKCSGIRRAFTIWKRRPLVDILFLARSRDNRTADGLIYPDPGNGTTP